MAELSAYRSAVYDWQNGGLLIQNNRVVVVTGRDALVQKIIKALQTRRGAFLIYARPDDADQNHKYGSDSWDVISYRDLSDEARISELKRSIRDALVYTFDWVLDVVDIEVYQEKGTDGVTVWRAAFNVKTTFDKENLSIKGVSLDG